MKRVAVINVVGLSGSLLGSDTPRLSAFAKRAGLQSFRPAFPAVTCSAQASMLTGCSPRAHGIVGNGWYDRENAEVRFWKQSNHLVRGEKIWEQLRQRLPDFSCANLFWWYNMYSTADFSMTPRPLYPADGRKVFDIHTHPMDWRDQVKAKLGDFPFQSFWGPAAGIACSRWIADAARWTERKAKPSLSFVYLPHLDYLLQKEGPQSSGLPLELNAIDQVAGDLIDFYEANEVRPIIVSEYGISAVENSIHLNRVFRARGWIRIKDELGRETLDCGSSSVFAVADHQVAHVYVKDPAMISAVRAALIEIPEIDEVRTAEEMWGRGIGTERAGDLVAIAKPNAWFTYYYWDNDECAPDFARTVDIHRKPGYDPAELFIDPEIKLPRWEVGKFLLKKKLGLRGLLEVVPLDAGLVKGSHGRDVVPVSEQPVILGADTQIRAAEDVHAELLAAF